MQFLDQIYEVEGRHLVLNYKYRSSKKINLAQSKLQGDIKLFGKSESFVPGESMLFTTLEASPIF